MDSILPDYVCILQCENIDRWIIDAKLIIKLLELLNSLEDNELLKKVNNSENIQQFLVLYVENTTKCFQSKQYVSQISDTCIELDKQIYRLIYEILSKILQFFSQICNDNKSNGNIINTFDMCFIMNMCCVYFYSSNMSRLISIYYTIYQNNRMNSVVDFISSFKTIFYVHINGDTMIDHNVFVCEIIHNLLCLLKILPQFYQLLVDEDIVLELGKAMSNPVLFTYTSNEYKLHLNRTIYLTYLHISLLRSGNNNPFDKLKVLLLDGFKNIPKVFVPIGYIYKLDDYIMKSFHHSIAEKDLKLLVNELQSYCNKYEFISTSQNDTHETTTFSSTDGNADDNMKSLLDIFSNLSIDILKKCLIYCDNDLQNTIDFIISNSSSEHQLDNITNDKLGSKIDNVSSSSSISSTMKNISISDNNKDITLQLVKLQEQEEIDKYKKIDMMADKYLITPTMAATLLHLDIDEYNDEYDDGFDDPHFQTLKETLEKIHSNNSDFYQCGNDKGKTNTHDLSTKSLSKFSTSSNNTSFSTDSTYNTNGPRSSSNSASTFKGKGHRKINYDNRGNKGIYRKPK